MVAAECGLSHCPHSIEVALMGDAAGDAIKTRWQRVRQAIGPGDAARVSTMDAGATAARRSPKPQTGVRFLRILQHGKLNLPSHNIKHFEI